MKKCIYLFPLVFFSMACTLFSPSNRENETFVEGLPASVRSQILWYCDFEDESFEKWEDAGTENENSGGGIFLTDEANISYGVSNEKHHTGRYGAFAEVRNAVNPGDNKAVRFMRWTDRAWDEEGEYFPDEAYYSVFLMFPEEYNPAKPPENDPYGDGGWWNVFQFKSDNNAGSQPVVVLDLFNDGEGMEFGLVIKDYPNNDSEDHTQDYYEQEDPLLLAPNEWVHIEVFLKKSQDYTGSVKVWQDGAEIFSVDDIRTVLPPPGETAAWGIGNYTDYVTGGDVPGEARVWFDDAVVSAVRVGN